MANEGSNSIPAAAEPTSEWVSRIGAGGIQGLLREFNTIRAEPMIGTIKAYEENPELNRYNNIPCLDGSRVKLNDGLNPSYIHANYVDGNRPKEYIITQAPMRKSIVDYWRMVWAEKISLIVCLTSLNERGNPKADQFFPMSTERPFRAGPLFIRAKSIGPLEKMNRVQLFHLIVTSVSQKDPRVVILIYYGNWPDLSVPKETPAFLSFVKSLRHFESWANKPLGPREPRPPVLVHCSAGVGRSATLVACRIALDQFAATDKVDIVGVVRRMRRQRALAVQNVLQYIFINLLVAEAVKLCFPKPAKSVVVKSP